jgi:hypothetical protein
VAAIAPGSKAKFKFRRQDQVLEATVSIAERPAVAAKR